MKTPNGGAAFPREGHDVEDILERDQPLRVVYQRSEGMTLRDYFAAQALIGPVAVVSGQYDGQERAKLGGSAWMAAVAYSIADAMLAEREK